MRTRRAPRFSVILPTYNRANLLVRAIASVLAQSDDDLELVVVDDGSTDDTQEVLARHVRDPRVTTIQQRRSGGAARARNAALRIVRGEFVAFVDSDDLWTPNHLAVRRRQLARSPRVDFLLGGVTCLGSPLLPDRDDPRRLVDVRSLYATAGTFVVRRELLTRVGGFPEVAYSEDGALLPKLLREARVARRVRDATYVYDRTGEDSICNRLRASVTRGLSAEPAIASPASASAPPNVEERRTRADAEARHEHEIAALHRRPSLLPKRASVLPPPVEALFDALGERR